MLINTGARTDTVQYYTPWLLRRFAEGYALVRNPLFPHQVSRYELDPRTVDCVLFCSKNYAPILPRLHEITSRFNTYFHYTITAYGTDIEPGVPSVEESIATLLELEKLVGRQRIAWRYDPVLLTKDYTPELHLHSFERMASLLAGHIDRCIFSFVELYRKLHINMPELVLFTPEQKDMLARGFGQTAQRYGIRLQTCGNNGMWRQYGIYESGCTTLAMLGAANGISFRSIKHKGMRAGCGCMESRDIGAYECCPNGCRYCYATNNPRVAVQNYKLHDPDSPLLIGQVQPDDTIISAPQKSFLKTVHNSEQLLLF